MCYAFNHYCRYAAMVANGGLEMLKRAFTVEASSFPEKQSGSTSEDFEYVIYAG